MNEPTLPIESIEPLDAVERKDPSDRQDHLELLMGACPSACPRSKASALSAQRE